MAKKCILCHVNLAALPDRDAPGRPIKRVCIPCHQKRLLSDVKKLLVGHHRFSHNGACEEGCYYETLDADLE